VHKSPRLFKPKGSESPFIREQTRRISVFVTPYFIDSQLPQATSSLSWPTICGIPQRELLKVWIFMNDACGDHGHILFPRLIHLGQNERFQFRRILESTRKLPLKRLKKAHKYFKNINTRSLSSPHGMLDE
jgi:hypothetical protein